MNLGLIAAAPLILIYLWVGDVIRPGSFSRRQVRDVKAQPAMVWLFAALVAYMGQYVGVGVVSMFAGAGGEPDARSVAIGGLGSAAGGVIAACFMVRLIAAGSGERMGLRFRIADVPMGLACAAMAIPVTIATAALSVWVQQMVTGEGPDPIAHSTLKLIAEDRWDPWVVVLIVNAVLGAPVVEELVYRALLQSTILRATGRVWAAVLATGAIFALSHRMGGAPVAWGAIPTLFVLGVGMGLAYERTRRLAVPIAMHAAFNAWNLGVMLVGGSG